MRYAPNKEAAESGGGGKAHPGEYVFKVDVANEVTFKTGGEGLKIELLVGAFNNRDIRVYVNLSYSEKAQWRLKQFMDAIGVDYYRPPESAHSLEGRTGRARFKANEKGYLEPDEYFPASANNGPDHSYGPPAWGEDPPPPSDPDQTPF